MKLTHKLCGAVLLGAVGVALAIPNTTKAADPDSKTGDMDIQFTRKTSGSVDIPNSEMSGSMSLSVDYKEFGVVAVTPLSFGEQQATATSRSYWAKNWTQSTGSSANFVAISDERAVADHRYTVAAQITKPLTSGSSVLAGSTVTLRNIHLQTQANIGDNVKLPAGAIVEPGSDRVVTNGESTLIINNTTPGAGIGTTTITFGHLNSADEKDSSKSVKLDIGKDDLIVEGDYRGEITWTMTEVK
ncbi:WxL domain-containing protein [Candidatus Enterococcus mansonii]|uniref:WxL domain-containing protein n=1 Tax=Candidatus Enterococcus mansonii TaxID=1834181 RepID=A0A242CCJ1_9ENTE|nr:WxL domain-containing protein [Enterococcus sp. 4G2_DIV0659]OTO07838.1 hypothetical protein A5880_002108 [Enterococcus sp. 4G2_DIV0659]